MTGHVLNAEILSAIKRGGAVPSMPQVVTRFLEIIQDAEFQYDDLVSVLSTDPGTASEILRLSNSRPVRRVAQDHVAQTGHDAAGASACAVAGARTLHGRSRRKSRPGRAGCNLLLATIRYICRCRSPLMRQNKTRPARRSIHRSPARGYRHLDTRPGNAQGICARHIALCTTRRDITGRDGTQNAGMHARRHLRPGAGALATARN